MTQKVKFVAKIKVLTLDLTKSVQEWDMLGDSRSLSSIQESYVETNNDNSWKHRIWYGIDGF